MQIIDEVGEVPVQKQVQVLMITKVQQLAEDDEDREEDDAPYVGRWCDLMSEDEGDERHEGDAGEPRQPADGGEEGHGGASDASRFTAENPPGLLRLFDGQSCHTADVRRILGRETSCAAAVDDTSGAGHYADADGRAAAADEHASDAYADYDAAFAADYAADWATDDDCDAVDDSDLAAAGGSFSAAATGDPTTARRRPQLDYAGRRLRLRLLRELQRRRLRRLLRGRLRPRRCADYVATGDSTFSLLSPASSPFSLPLSFPADLASDQSGHSGESYALTDRLRRALEQRQRAAGLIPPWGWSSYPSYSSCSSCST